ncbi:UDP-glucosyltransferase 2-like [Musca vetustissima]|uniref:UDP-glucosyltransferase 2-like n=1 Tax=Musca vetustissima TaxID=27455 RepID=UPI002AB6693B|nr:UDP-glucosyltransferase 2-like [Musca vetustissima]
MYYKIVAILLLVVITTQPLQSARILSIFGHEGPSQYIFVEPLLKRLAERGHFVTSITNFEQNVKNDHLRSIFIRENRHLCEALQNATNKHFDIEHFSVNGKIFSIAYQIAANILKNPEVVNMVQKETFDLIILDVIFAESLYGLLQYFDAPIIGMSIFGSSVSIDGLMGNSSPLSYVSSLTMTHRQDENMNFWKRFLNTMEFILGSVYVHYEYMPANRRFYERQFPNATKTIEDIQKKYAMIFLNDHPVITSPRPYVPNMIEVAGLHIPEIPEPLADHVYGILNNTHAFIYIAIGNLFPQNIMPGILNQLEQLPYPIIWNANNSPSSALRIPANVKFYTNLSHYALLAHPNCKLLISSGNFLSVIESIHFGLPILGLAYSYGNPEYDYRCKPALIIMINSIVSNFEHDNHHHHHHISVIYKNKNTKLCYNYNTTY